MPRSLKSPVKQKSCRPAAHHGDHEIARRQPRDGRPHFDDLTERFVSDHEPRLAGRRRSVLEGADLPVGATDTDVQHAELHVAGVAHAGGILIDQHHLALPGDDGDGFHATFDAGRREPVAGGLLRRLRDACRRPDGPKPRARRGIQEEPP
jgi:hypothetical protein